MFSFLRVFLNKGKGSVDSEMSADADIPPWAERLLQKIHSDIQAENKQMIAHFEELTWQRMRTTPSPMQSTIEELAWNGVLAQLPDSDEDFALDKPLPASRDKPTPDSSNRSQSPNVSSSNSVSPSSVSLGSSSLGSSSPSSSSLSSNASNAPASQSREDPVWLERVDGYFKLLTCQQSQLSDKLVAWMRDQECHRGLKDEQTAQLERRWTTVQKHLEAFQLPLQQNAKFAELLPDIQSAVSAISALQLNSSFAADGWFKKLANDHSEQLNTLRQQLEVQARESVTRLTDLPRLIESIVASRLESMLSPAVRDLTGQLRSVAESLKESTQQTTDKLAGASDLLERARSALNEALEMRAALDSQARSIEETRRTLSLREAELKEFDAKYREDQQAYESLQTQHAQLSAEVQRLQNLEKSLAETEHPQLLEHAQLADEAIKLGDESSESVLALGTIYHFGSSLQAVKLHPDNLEYLSNLQESIVQLGISLMRHANRPTGERIQADRWRKATEDAVGAWFKIHLPIAGQPFNPSLMDTTKTGTVRRVKSWAVIPSDSRLRIKVAIVE